MSKKKNLLFKVGILKQAAQAVAHYNQQSN